MINGFFVDLGSARSRHGWTGWAGAWRHGVDARRWLAEHGAARLDCDGPGSGSRMARRCGSYCCEPAGAGPAAVGRSRLDQAPVDVVLVVTSRTTTNSRCLFEPALTHKGALAGTTVAALADARPAGAIWATGPQGGNRDRLADFGPMKVAKARRARPFGRG